jgi:glycerol-3-phosphate acyltransferase PlsY
MTLVLAALLGYLLGSVPFAVLVSRAFGLSDPRHVGSGNPGATNVLRSGNKAAAALTLLGDAAKGWIAMFVAEKLGADGTAVAAAGLAAFIGHVYPFTLGFRGGKGVATALGVMIFFSGQLAGIVAAAWLAVVATTRYSSLAALVAAASAPLLAGWLIGRIEVVFPVTVMSGILIARHKGNIQKLLTGTEHRIGTKKPVQES